MVMHQVGQTTEQMARSVLANAENRLRMNPGHTQDASYLDVIQAGGGEWNPSDYAYHLTRRARGDTSLNLVREVLCRTE